jgi:hypothetical protein
MSHDTEPAFTPDSSNKERPADDENTENSYFRLRERKREALIANFLLNAPKCIAVAMLVSLLWIVISALVKNATSKEYVVRWPGRANFNSEFGISDVSGFYGPGSWAAWMLTFASCFLARIFVDEKQTGEKWAHLLTLDVNLVSAYAYPLVAAVDVLLHTRTIYWLGEEASSRYFGPMSASIAVLRTGAVFGAFLSIVLGLNWWRTRKHLRSLVFSCLLTAFFLVTINYFEIRYFDLEWGLWVPGLIPILPYFVPGFHEGRQQGCKLARLLSQSIREFAYSGSDIPVGSYAQIGLREKGFKMEFFGVVGSSFEGLGYLLLVFLLILSPLFLLEEFRMFPAKNLLRVVGSILVSMELTLAVFLLLTQFSRLFYQWGSPLPWSIASFEDLDQLCTFIFSGILIVVCSLLDIFTRYADKNSESSGKVIGGSSGGD